MRVYSTDSVVVTFEETEGRLQLVCGANFSSTEFRNSLTAALQFASDHHIKQWLLDYHAIGSLEEAEETWLQTHFFPKVMITMGTENYVAIVLSDKCFQALLREAGLFGLQSYNSYIIINTFSHISEAAAWLRRSALSPTS